MKQEPLCYIPSPYGTPVAGFGDPAKEDFFHDMQGCMDMAGIYGAENRAACLAKIKEQTDTTGQARFATFMEFGGHKVPKSTLPRPRAAIYPTLPRTHDMGPTIENWVTLAMDASNWTMRAASFLDVLEGNIAQIDGFDMPKSIGAIALQLILTAAVEHLADTEVDCLEAAAFYALTAHPEWSAVGATWLAPFRETWFSDWKDARPTYRKYAALCHEIDPALPAWIAG